jgi:hypothetical protein
MFLTANPIEFHSWIKGHLTPGEFAELTLTAMKPIRLDPPLRAHIEGNLQRELKHMELCREAGAIGRIEFSSPYLGEVQPLVRKPRKKPAPSKFKKTLRRGTVLRAA